MRSLSLMFICLLLAGCSFWGEDIQEPLTVQGQLTVKVTTQRNINQNVNGQASPLELRIYQLSSDDAFNQAQFLQIYNDEQGVLKSDLISTRHLPSILPGQTLEQVLPMSLETRYIAVFGEFANYREAKSKAIYKVDQFGLVTVVVSVDGINLSISGAEDK